MKTPEQNREAVAAWRARMSTDERREYDRARYHKHKDRRREQHNEQNRRWMKAHPEVGQAAGVQSRLKSKYPEAWAASSITNKELAEYIKNHRAEHVCKYCGDPCEQIDHVVPLSQGGQHSWDNIQCICARCNMTKGTGSEEEFIAWVNRLITYRVEL